MPHRLVVLLAVLLPSLAAAHDLLPRHDWCSLGRPVVIAELDPAPDELGQTVEMYCSDAGRNCGEFDDYTKVLHLLQDVCDSYESGAAASTPGDFGDVIVLPERPVEFTRDDHHRAYRTTLGIRAVCVRCDRLPALPLPTPAPVR
ncbi:hypothetical protein [Tahibacter caeni]|uniref:hypothetical protein n=1 Tax=Tahibacter caeni TaxID=1453545 RepID=UPI0021478DDF|nr:hypothetical protein [Tahibacter caeni]